MIKTKSNHSVAQLSAIRIAFQCSSAGQKHKQINWWVMCETLYTAELCLWLCL